MISNSLARRYAANPNAITKARKDLADSLREMRRSAYDILPENPFVGHVVARAMFREYRRLSRAVANDIMEGRHGEKIH